MKLLLLKTLLLQKYKNKGFILPLTIAIALVILLFGGVNLILSNPENMQNSTNIWAAAKSQMVRYWYLLENNRVATVHRLEQWTDLKAYNCNSPNKSQEMETNRDRNLSTDEISIWGDICQ